MSRAVVLLKSPARELADDEYVSQFLAFGYKPYFVGVLDSAFSNEDLLEDTIRAGADAYDGVVVTSIRAAEAWIHALHNVETPGNWSNLPFYVVGEATASTLKRITTSHPSHFSEKLILGATQSGKSESLAQFVLSDLTTRNGGGKLLYLTGDKNKDTFNRMMTEGGVVVENLCVYETTAASNLEDEIDRVAGEIKEGIHAKSTWIVFFAPSSTDFALPYLRRHFQWSEARGLSGQARMNAKLATIGPTTAKFLRTERGLKVDAVASKPTPKQLVEAICDVEDRDQESTT